MFSVFQNGHEIAFGLARSQAERLVYWARKHHPSWTYAIVAAE